MKSFAFFCLSLFLLLARTSVIGAEPIISEFMANNTRTLSDEDGQFSDWIEIQNPNATPFNLAGYFLTDNSLQLNKWAFPSVTLPANGFLVVFASGKDRRVPGAPLHTSFPLDNAGEYFALIRPDGVTVEQEFAPAFPPQEQDVSYGISFTTVSTTFVTDGKTAKWRVPVSAAELAADWASTNFDDSAWATGPIALGFDAGQVIGGGGGATTNLARGRTAMQSSTFSTFTAGLAVDGNKANVTHTSAGQNLPSTWEVNLGTNAAIAGIVIYNRSDCCGSRLRDITVRILSLDGTATNFTSALLNAENTLGGGSLNGPLTLTLTNFPDGAVLGGRVRLTRTPDPDLSGTGGQGNADEANVLSLAEVEVFGANAPLTFDSIVRTDIEAAMRNLNASAFVRVPFLVVLEDLPALDLFTLRMKYDDGFVAYLNGVKVAEANAAASLSWNSAATGEHADTAALQFETFDLTPHAGLLQDGINVLAIQGLNRTAPDDDFLVLPELSGLSVGVSIEQYFTQPTPGSTNRAGTLGLVADSKFSVDRGFFDVPFIVAITTATAGAEIRYTTNGSAPTAVSGVLYNGPIQISRTTVLRALASKPGWTPSNVDTHTYLFLSNVVAQSQASVTSSGYPTTWSGVGADYAMDPRITGPNATQMVSSLRSLPSLFISTSISNLFDAARGIYSHPTSHGVAWERPVSLELVDTNGATEFQEDCGLRIQGGYFRDPNVTQKHSLRALFKSQYGPGKLRHDLFKTDSAVTEFDGLVLRAGANDGYSWDAARDTEQFTRDEFGRNLHQDMGHPAPHGLFVHLYLNGVYWGLYNVVERANEDFSASYFGGDPLEWDANNAGDVKNGDLQAWNSFTSQATAARTTSAYQRLQGANPDGSRNAAFPVYLDKLNYIDYMIANIWGGNWDWPNKNFWFGRQRTTNSTGFKFYMWDFENVMGNNRDRSPVNMVSPRSGIESSWVSIPHFNLKNVAEYRIDFADRVQRYFFNGGLLTPNTLINRYRALAGLVELSIFAESARWGDDNLNPPQDIVDWRRERDWILGTYLPQRSAVVLQQFRTAGLFPSISAPAFGQLGGEVPAGYSLAMTHTNVSGAILFTTDGSDPRVIGGAVSSWAQSYSAPLPINSPMQVRARVRTGTNWSAVLEYVFYPPQDLSKLLVTEIMYHPPAAGVLDGDEFEFLELKNAGTNTLNLSGLRFNGISFTFTNGTTLAPGQFFVLVRNATRFASKYPGVAINGIFTGGLANGGEPLTLLHPLGGQVLSAGYDDLAPWPVAPDDFGFSLVPVNPNSNPDPENPANWRASTLAGGSPGADDPASAIGRVHINEVLTHSEAGLDFIELFNPTAAPINIGGWFLTDDPDTPKKYRIANNTTIAPLGYLVFHETQFNPTPGTNNSFSLSARGDDVYLFSGDANTNLTGYSHGFVFGAAPDGVTFGRYVISTGEEHFPQQIAATPGQPNPGPRVGPVVINEVMYHPDTSGDEFIELKNVTANVVPLYDPAYATNTWRLNGLDYTFPTNITLGPSEFLLLVATNPAAFRLKYGVPASVAILGPYAGTLQDSGELLELQRPDVPDSNGVAYVTVDEVRYNDKAPWPAAADGSGPSLQRKNSAAYGNDPANWEAAAATAGAVFIGGQSPTILAQPRSQTVVAGQTALLSVAAAGQAPLQYRWRFNGNTIRNATGSNLVLTSVQLAQAGDYTAVIFNEAGSVASAVAHLTVNQPPSLLTPPTNQFVRLGSNALFSVVANGNGLLRYQWHFNATNIAGATNPTLLVTNAHFENEGAYTVTVSDSIGPITSAPVRLIILVEPIVVQQPLSQNVVAGDTVILSISVTNNATLPIGYRLRRNSIVLPEVFVSPSQRTAFFTITNAEPQFTNYTILVTNAARPSGFLSSPAILTFLTDTDGDRIPDEWEAAHGFGTNNLDDAALDADLDRMLNWQEYVAGTDPTNALSYLNMQVEGTPGAAVLKFGAVSNRTYTVQFNEALPNGSWTKLADVPARATNRIEIVTDTGRTNRYYRVVTPRQP